MCGDAVVSEGPELGVNSLTDANPGDLKGSLGWANLWESQLDLGV